MSGAPVAELTSRLYIYIYISTNNFASVIVIGHRHWIYNRQPTTSAAWQKENKKKRKYVRIYLKRTINFGVLSSSACRRILSWVWRRHRAALVMEFNQLNFSWIYFIYILRLLLLLMYLFILNSLVTTYLCLIVCPGYLSWADAANADTSYHLASYAS